MLRFPGPGSGEGRLRHGRQHPPAAGGRRRAMIPDETEFWLKDQLGFTIERGDGRAVAVMDCDERHLNPHGVVHGAALFALIDTAMGAATMSVIDDASRCATIEIHTRFLAPVRGGRVEATVEVIGAGRRVVQLDAAVTDQQGRTVARATGSFAVSGG